MEQKDRIIAGITLAHSALGALWTFFAGSHIGFPPVFMVANLALVALGAAASILRLRGRRDAAWLIAAFYFVQCFHVMTPAFQWSFTLGLNFVISIGWYGAGQIGLNFFAVPMMIWALARAAAPDSKAPLPPP